MIIRRAEEQDISKIITLLKLSLGESLMPKSESYWRWKHIDNPFGASPVLIAEDGGKVVGVRAFMLWQWVDGEKVYRAVRAVDTATHPAYQGKGIFKKLTLQLIETCKQDNIDFIFNTPNGQSRPGYLKMGWQDAGRLPVRFQLVNPLSRLYARLRNKAVPALPFSQWCVTAEAATLLHEINRRSVGSNGLRTNVTKAYLIWRYASVPVVNYFAITAITDRDYELLVYRIKQSKVGLELRITEYLTNGSTLSKELYDKLMQCAYALNAYYITYSGVSQGHRKGVVLKKGPIVTIRNLDYTGFIQLINFTNWKPSLGDLELF